MTSLGQGHSSKSISVFNSKSFNFRVTVRVRGSKVRVRVMTILLTVGLLLTLGFFNGVWTNFNFKGRSRAWEQHDFDWLICLTVSTLTLARPQTSEFNGYDFLLKNFLWRRPTRASNFFLSCMLSVHMSVYQPLTSSQRKRRHTMHGLRRALFRIELEDSESKTLISSTLNPLSRMLIDCPQSLRVCIY